MYELPPSVLPHLNLMFCPNCKKGVKQEGIVAVGIGRGVEEPEKDFFFFEYDCDACGNKTIHEVMAMTVEEFVMEMLDSYTNSDQIKPTPQKSPMNPNKRCKISDAEVNEAKKIINGEKFWLDMLRKLGSTEEQIQENAFYIRNLDKGKKGKKSKGKDKKDADDKD